MRKLILTAALLLIISTGLPVNYADARQQSSLLMKSEEMNFNYTVTINCACVSICLTAKDVADIDMNDDLHRMAVENNIILVASIPEEGTYLYSLNYVEKDRIFNNMLLSANGVYQIFYWENLAFIETLPELYYVDFDSDNVKELVADLTKNRGTGASVHDIHILNPENLSEYRIEDPISVINDNVEINVITSKIVEIKINNSSAIIDIDKVPYDQSGYYPDTISSIYFEDMIYYEIIDEKNVLKATIGLEAATVKYIGIIEIHYSFINGEFKADQIGFNSPAFTEEHVLGKVLEDDTI